MLQEYINKIAAGIYERFKTLKNADAGGDAGNMIYANVLHAEELAGLAEGVDVKTHLFQDGVLIISVIVEPKSEDKLTLRAVFDRYKY